MISKDKIFSFFPERRINMEGEKRRLKKTFMAKIFKDPYHFAEKKNVLEWITTEAIYSEQENKEGLIEPLGFEKFINEEIPFLKPYVAICKEVGRECGIVKRLLEEKSICWGFFFDHNPCLPHCNAHPNNFVVNEDNLEQSLLAPLDFDMSFEERTFVSTVEDLPEKYGTQDREQFDSWLNSERYELESALGGEENMANF